MYEKMPVRRAVLSNALPCVAAMLMTLVYNLADTFFIGQTHNDLLVAAVSVATPVFLLFLALGNVFGIGGTSVISRALGEHREDYAKRVNSFCFWGSLFSGAALTVIFLTAMDPILGMVGATEQTWSAAKEYLVIVSSGGSLLVIASNCSNILRAEGQPVKAMTGQVMGNIVNIVLDPVFILVLEQGAAGAAVATVLGNAVSVGYYLVYYLRGKSKFGISIRQFTVRHKIFSNVFAIGVPAALGSMLMSVSQILLNSEMAKYGDMAVAGIGVAGKVLMITGMICIGIASGVQPLLGYCVGARIWDRYKATMRFTLMLAAAVSTLMTVLCYAFQSQIVSVFLTDPVAVSYGLSFCSIMLSTGFLFGIYYTLTNALQACGAATKALVANISRQGIVFIPVMYILGAMFHEMGLVWAQPVADIVSFLLTWFLYRSEIKKLMSEPAAVLTLATT